MQPAIGLASGPLDLSTVTAEGLYDLVPDVGFFLAEDIIAWRDAHEGRFPDETALIDELGLAADVAATVARLAERESGIMLRESPAIAESAKEEKEEEEKAVDSTVAAPDSGPYFQADGVVELVEPAPAVAEEESPRRSPLPPPLPHAPARELDGIAVTPRDTAETAAPVAMVAPPAPRWRRRIAAAVLVLVAVNAGLAFGIVQTRREGRRAVAPIGAISSDLATVKNEQAESRSALDATRNELEETRRELAKQASILQATTAAAGELAAHQKATDHDLKELANREASDVATLAARLRERRNADGSVGVNLGEAIQIIDAAQGKPAAKVETHAAPRAAEHDKPAVTPAIDW